MNNKELIELSDKLKVEGEKVLKDSNLVEILSSFGEVHIKGSFVLNLLLDEKDIDFTVVNKDLNLEIVLDCFNKIIETQFWESYKFTDRIKYPVSGESIKGYKLGTSRKRIDKWETDVFFVKEDNGQNQRLIEKVQELLTEEKREIILKLKSIRKEKNIFIESHKIYEAVLMKEIKDFESLLEIRDELNYFEYKA